MLSVLETALAYHAAGLSVLPVRPDGSKAPALPRGHPYLYQRPREEDLYRWFARGVKGIGVACGRVSGNLETLDFETLPIYRTWRERVEKQAPGLAGRLCLVRTPGHFGVPGVHARYRCPEITIPGPTALTFGPASEEGGRPCLLIETRGEGSYAIAPGSPASCHETHRRWEHVGGPDLLHLPELAPWERDVLLACARALDTKPAPRYASVQVLTLGRGNGLRPGDDYNRRGPDWLSLLGPHGWDLVRCSGPARYWRRPGKTGSGWSATTGYCRSQDGNDLLYVFSANAHPFEARAGYSRFRVYALLTHHGDFREAARALARHGFGDPGHPFRRRTPAANRGQAWAPAAHWYHEPTGICQPHHLHRIGLEGEAPLIKGAAPDLSGRAPTCQALRSIPKECRSRSGWHGPPTHITRLKDSEALAGPSLLLPQRPAGGAEARLAGDERVAWSMV